MGDAFEINHALHHYDDIAATKFLIYVSVGRLARSWYKQSIADIHTSFSIDQSAELISQSIKKSSVMKV